MAQIILIFWLITFIILSVLAGWTQDELGYVISIIEGHAVHIPFIIALIINYLCNGAIITFDFIIMLLRVCGVI
jgi:hypothetical protein